MLYIIVHWVFSNSLIEGATQFKGVPSQRAVADTADSSSEQYQSATMKSDIVKTSDQDLSDPDRLLRIQEIVASLALVIPEASCSRNTIYE